jgi:hypothetical protein
VKRAIVTAAIAATLAGGAMGPPDNVEASPAGHSQVSRDANATWRDRECRYGGLEKGGWAQREVVQTIECAVARWPVAGGSDFAVQVAACESGLRADAWNPSGYAGVFQHAVRYWPQRIRNLQPSWDKPLSRSVFNARANIVVAIRMAHVSWGPWSCAR